MTVVLCVIRKFKCVFSPANIENLTARCGLTQFFYYKTQICSMMLIVYKIEHKVA